MIVDQIHLKRLEKSGINICAKYKSNGKILERTTDKAKNRNANIENAVCLEKDYYKNKRLIGKIFNFDPRIQYTYIASNNGENIVECPNCGHKSMEKDISEGCQYCGTNYNIEYVDKDLGNKYHYDRVLQGSNYRSVTLIIDILISALIVFTYIITTNRTFNIYDISKIVLGTIILSLILYYIFYMLDAVVIMLPIKIYKDKLNKRQAEFWERMNKLNVNKKTFYNNINYELQHYYYGDCSENKNIIDYDIIDYISLNEKVKSDRTITVTVNTRIRTIELSEDKIIEKIRKKEFTFQKNTAQLAEIHAGVNVIKCRNCAASIDITKGECEYCKTKVNNYQEWYLIKK